MGNGHEMPARPADEPTKRTTRTTRSGGLGAIAHCSGKMPRRGQAVHESRPVRETVANAASQTPASHHELLQAVQ